jgi:hypothetical protein
VVFGRQSGKPGRPTNPAASVQAIDLAPAIADLLRQEIAERRFPDDIGMPDLGDSARLDLVGQRCASVQGRRPSESDFAGPGVHALRPRTLDDSIELATRALPSRYAIGGFRFLTGRYAGGVHPASAMAAIASTPEWIARSPAD